MTTKMTSYINYTFIKSREKGLNTYVFKICFTWALHFSNYQLNYLKAVVFKLLLLLQH